MDCFSSFYYHSRQVLVFMQYLRQYFHTFTYVFINIVIICVQEHVMLTKILIYKTTRTLIRSFRLFCNSKQDDKRI